MTQDASDQGSYDVIVIGGGSTGTNVAWYARDNGLSVALVESRLVGGECSYVHPEQDPAGPVGAGGGGTARAGSSGGGDR